MMHHATDSRYRINGPMDDVAANIRTDQREAPDPDPLMPCHGCDREHRASHFKQFGQVDANPEVPVLCPQCLKVPTGIKSVEERQQENQQLTEFAGQ